MSNTIVERIKAGTRPTEILREQKANHPDMTSHNLASWLAEQIGLGMTGAAFHAIWWWKGSRENGTRDDAYVDAAVLASLRHDGLL
jgi:hypothetical protein